MQKIKPWRSKKYLAWIRTKPCSHCRVPGTEPHHITGWGGTMGGKPSDIHAIPLCHLHHMEVHADPIQWKEAQIYWLIKMQLMAMNEMDQWR